MQSNTPNQTQQKAQAGNPDNQQKYGQPGQPSRDPSQNDGQPTYNTPHKSGEKTTGNESNAKSGSGQPNY